jgi:pimeloyl-ACP methyl ester carboxylesterase
MPDISTQEFSFNSKKGRPFLADIHYPSNASSFPLIIFCHGFKGFKDWGHFNLLARKYAEKGYGFLKFNFSMNGISGSNLLEITDLESFGRNTFSMEMDDLDILINEILKSEFAPKIRHILMMGHSRGGGTALLKTSHDVRISGAVALASVHDFAGRWPKEIIDKWRSDGVMHVPNSRTGLAMPVYFDLAEDFIANRSFLDIPAAMKALKVPVLLFHGDMDETLPVETAYELDSHSAFSQLHILEGSGHTFGGRHPWTSDELPEDVQFIFEESLRFFEQNQLQA